MAAVRLKTDVTALAAGIGERNVWTPEKLRAADAYITGRLTTLGFECRRQEYEAEGVTVANLEAEIAGGAKRAEIIVVGAHYDSRCGMRGPRGTARIPGLPGTPGANDNASGIAGVLEIGRMLAGERPERTVRLVAFVNEEHPFFQTPLMGSWVYARRCRERGEQVAAMISLETLGCYADAPGTQRYPFPFGLFLPSTGNYIALLSNLRSRRMARTVLAGFRRHTAFPARAQVAEQGDVVAG